MTAFLLVAISCILYDIIREFWHDLHTWRRYYRRIGPLSFCVMLVLYLVLKRYDIDDLTSLHDRIAGTTVINLKINSV